ncbi:MAG TPA: alkaline phosphatase family protein [Candidatus Binatia bacterium]|nr:alkaline phosphatase family protein [Candidatus Binatia bacterium]
MRALLSPLVLIAAVAVASAARAIPPPPLPPLCGLVATPPARWEHVVWIFFENHSYDEIVGAPDAPFMNHALIPRCGLATNYRDLTHPSVPNYIAATSGLPLNALGPLANDCNATGPCHTNAPSIFSLAPSWGAYEESMHRPCTHFFTGAYAASHNPAVYYTTLANCAANDVNIRALRPALDADTLPAFVFITPNMCHSMHNCSVGTGDGWLRHVIRRLGESPAYMRGTMAIFVTFDESDPDDSDDRIATLVISPSTPVRTRSGEPFSHYALLRTTEEMLGLQPLLGEARRARSMRPAFDL